MVLVFGVIREDDDKFVTLRFIVELFVDIILVVDISVVIISDVVNVLDNKLLEDRLVLIKLVIDALGAEKMFEMRRLDVVSDCV